LLELSGNNQIGREIYYVKAIEGKFAGEIVDTSDGDAVFEDLATALNELSLKH
jgi:hypothetical protein